MCVEHLHIIFRIYGTSVQIMTAVLGIGPSVDVVAFVTADCITEVVAFAWHKRFITQIVA